MIFLRIIQDMVKSAMHRSEPLLFNEFGFVELFSELEFVRRHHNLETVSPHTYDPAEILLVVKKATKQINPTFFEFFVEKVGNFLCLKDF